MSIGTSLSPPREPLPGHRSGEPAGSARAACPPLRSGPWDGAGRRPGYTWAVWAYDRLYRIWHSLDAPGAQAGPLLRFEVRPCARVLRFADGTQVEVGKPVCALHLDNERLRQIYTDCSSPVRVGLDFRRRLFASLRELARLAEPNGRLAHVEAFSATTIFHSGLRYVGFEAAGDRLPCPRLVAFYQRALLASIHPAGRLRLRQAHLRGAARLWISRRAFVQAAGPDALGVKRWAAGSRRTTAASARPAATL